MEKKKNQLIYSDIDYSVRTHFHKNGDAGYDMYATKDVWLWPLKITKVPLNFKCEIPNLRFGLLTSRSGESLKGNIVIPGIIDCTYRGQISAIMTKISLFPTKIKKGTRIAQLIFIPYEEYDCKYSINLSDSIRGEDGFGSTGKE